MEDKLIRELPEKSHIDITDRMIIEDNDGTKIADIQSLKSIMSNSIFFNNINDMKSADLNQGDTCITLGYRYLNDGGSGTYLIEYDPKAVEDGGLVQYLNTSDVLRAKLIHNKKINVNQFGAVGDGKVDDSAFIQAAIDTELPIEFTSGATYKIKTPLKIHSNQEINFNWCTIIPVNTNAFEIYGDPIKSDILHNIKLCNVNIDCSNNSNAINLSLINNIDISNINIYGMDGLNRAIQISSCNNFNIHDGYISGLGASGTGIYIDSIDSDYINFETNVANISNINFLNLEKAIHLYSDTDNIYSLSINNINISNDTLERSTYAFYISGYSKSMNIFNVKSKNMNEFMYITNISNGDVELKNIRVYNSTTVYNDLSSKFNIILTGYHNYDGNKDNDTDKYIIFGRLYGNLYIYTNSISINNNIYDNIKTSLMQGHLYDNTDPALKDLDSILSNTNTLTNTYFTNKRIDWCSSSNIENIEGGIDGQLFYIYSTDEKKIKSSAKIILSNNVNSIQLTKNNGVTLRYSDNSWIQIVR